MQLMKINKIISTNYNHTKADIKSNYKDLTNFDTKNDYPLLSYAPSYYMKNLSFKGKTFLEQLKYQLKTGSEDELFAFFERELKRKAISQFIKPDAIDDMVQNVLISIYLIIRDFNEKEISEEDCISEIMQIYDTLKAHSTDYPSEYWVKSLNKDVSDGDGVTLLDLIPDDNQHRITYPTQKSDEEKEEEKRQVSLVLSKANLDERSENLLKDRYSQSIPMQYDALGKKYNIDATTASLIVKSALIKTQLANDVLPKKYKKAIRDIASTLNIDYETAQNLVIKNPFLLGYTKDTLKNRINAMVEAFKDNGLTADRYTQACMKYSKLLMKNPKTLENNLRTFYDKFKDYGFSIDDYLSAYLKQPRLFAHSPDNLEKNIRKATEKFKNNGMTVETYLECGLKYPVLLSSSPDTVERNIRETVNLFSDKGLNLKQYLNAAIKYPSLFVTPPKKIEGNINLVVEKFKEDGLTTEKYLKACIKINSLFYQSANTIQRNIVSVVERFRENGLTTENYIKSACKKPILFCLSPKTPIEKVTEVIEMLDVNPDTYIKSCVKQPQLFFQSPQSLIKHVFDTVNNFADYNLKLNDYIQCCLRKPQLFCMSPVTIKNNVEGLVARYEDKGITTYDYLKSCLVSPSLFECLPDTIAEHIDARMFAYFNTGKMTSEEETIKKIISRPVELNFSTKLILIKYLLIPKIFENRTMPKRFMRYGNYEEKLEEYLKNNSDEKYIINIKRYGDDTAFIEIISDYLQELSNKVWNKNDGFCLNIQE